MTMTTSPQALELPFGRPLTYADLEATPDDGHRYELLDGVLVVTPSPVMRHQRASHRLEFALEVACSDDLEVFDAPFNVVLAEDTVLVPDLLAARPSDLAEKNLPKAPVLAVEVLSPSTKWLDLTWKKEHLEMAGCAHYWVVDPEQPAITAWDLVDGSYVHGVHAEGDQPFTVEAPFPLTVVPAELVDERSRPGQ